MYYVHFYISSEQVLEKLSDEDKKRFNKCVPIDINKDIHNGYIDVVYALFSVDEKIDEEIEKEKNKHRKVELKDLDFNEDTN